MAMTIEEFNLGNELLWDAKIGPSITTNQEISEKLANDLREAGISVTRVGRKPRSRQKFILFEIEAVRIVGLEMAFLTVEEAQDWHQAKNRSIKTMMKAPNEAFEPVKTEKSTEILYWVQAFKLAFRAGKIEHAKEDILRHRGTLYGKKYGL